MAAHCMACSEQVALHAYETTLFCTDAVMQSGDPVHSRFFAHMSRLQYQGSGFTRVAIDLSFMMPHVKLVNWPAKDIQNMCSHAKWETCIVFSDHR